MAATELALWREFLTESPDDRFGRIHCGLCGNHGIIRRNGLVMPNGLSVKPITSYCICPNGRMLKDRNEKLPPAASPKIAIYVEGGVVTDVEGLPEGWDYKVFDHDDAVGFADEDSIARYHNFYECEDCDEKWSDADCDSMHDDKCPGCNKAYTPYRSVGYDENAVQVLDTGDQREEIHDPPPSQ